MYIGTNSLLAKGILIQSSLPFKLICGTPLITSNKKWFYICLLSFCFRNCFYIYSVSYNLLELALTIYYTIGHLISTVIFTFNFGLWNWLFILNNFQNIDMIDRKPVVAVLALFSSIFCLIILTIISLSYILYLNCWSNFLSERYHEWNPYLLDNWMHGYCM